MSGETQLPSDSICTEDFVKCFREEMVDLTLPEESLQQQLSKEEEAVRQDISDRARFQSERKRPNISRTGTKSHGRSSREELREHVCDSYEVKTSHVCQKAAGESCKAPKKLGDDSSSEYTEWTF